MRAAVFITQAEAARGREIGGKAAQLFRLKDLGMPVPAFGVVPADVDDARLADELPLALRDAFPDAEDQCFAVRSSAVDEDGEARSFAGLFQTFLQVPLHEVAQRVRDIRASVHADRVRSYRTAHGLAMQESIGVVVQRMVRPEVAGVAFGADPAGAPPGTMVVSAVYGLGEGLVDGSLDADTWRMRDGHTAAHIVHKHQRVVPDPSGTGTHMEAVPAALRDVPCLDARQLERIAAVLRKLEDAMGGPQDIEFAFGGEGFHLLQARPITTLPEGEYTVWDNSNIVESYPGVTTPLTFSFIVRMYEEAYMRFVLLLGVGVGTVRARREVFANTLGLVRGRVYYNLLNWYRMLAMVPGYRINARFMETMMGVKERFDLKETRSGSKLGAWARIALMLLRMLWLFITLPWARRRFQAHLDRVMAEYEALDLNRCTADELRAHYGRFERTLLRRWKAPLTNDFFAMVSFGMLQKLCLRWVGPGHPNLHNDLLCGSRDIISTEPIHRSMAIAAMVHAEDEARRFFTLHDGARIWQAMREGAFPAVKAEVDAYLARFGERCIGELKLESISHAQDPTRFVEVLRAYVRNGITGGMASGGGDERIRAAAEATMAEALHGKPLKRALLRRVLRATRTLVSQRENLRYERTRGFGMVRRMCNALGERLAAEGVLHEPRDIFFLELDEAMASPTPSDGSLARKAAERRALFDGYRAEPDPAERFFTFGHDFSEARIRSTAKLEPVSGDLKGIGCCPGVVEGRVRKVMDPTTVASLDGDILVTSSTDPGWVTLFPSAGAIVVERGSLLSHSAIVAREMGIPCIVGVPGLLRSLHTGDRIAMDGSTGIIRIIEKHDGTPA